MPRMQANSVNIGGRVNNFYFTDFDVIGQNEDGNFSTIDWRSYFHFDGADAQLDNGYTDVAGRRWTNGGRVYNYAANFTTRDLFLASGQFTIGHDGNGNLTIHVAGGITPFDTPRSEAGANFGIPGLYQAIAYNSISITNVTDISFVVNTSYNRTSNLLQLSIDGGPWTTYVNGNHGSTSVQAGSQAAPLSSGVQHSVALRIRRASNGWITDSGTYFFTTEVAGKFFDFGVGV